jgi:hypothetical protein
MSIHYALPSFPFHELHLASPVALQGGSFYTKLNSTSKDENLYIYTPACSTKQGVVTSGNKQYIDFIFTNTNSNFITWVDALEERLQLLLYEKRSTWFITEDIELDDIQNAFIPIMKTKSNQHIVRAYLPQKKVEPIQVYNEDEIPMSMSDIKETSQLISILDISGIKFTQKCFQIVINIKQIMILEQKSFSNCMIKTIKESKKEQPVKTPGVDIEEIVTIEEIPKLDSIVIKSPSEVYKQALARAHKIEEEAELAKALVKELKETYDFDE